MTEKAEAPFPLPPPTSREPRMAVPYEVAFELTGHGYFNHLGLIACSLIFIHATLEMAAIAYIVTPAECDLRLSVMEKSMINSAIYIGIVKTAILWGTLTDRLGRRKIVLPTVLVAVFTSFCSSLCETFWPMFIFRLLTGYMISASSVTVLVYLGEIQTKAYRDQAISIAVTSAQMSFLILPAFAWIIIPGTWSFYLGDILIRPWRVFMWSWGITGLGGAGILFMLPESPRFLLATKGPLAAQPVLAKMYAWNSKKKSSEYPVTSVSTPSHISQAGGEVTATNLADMLHLIKPPMLVSFILTHSCMFMTFLLCNGLWLWMPDFINEMLKDVTLKNSVCDLINQKYLKSLEGPAFKPEDTYHCEEGKVNTYVYPTAMVTEIIYLSPCVTIVYFIDKHSKTRLYSYVMLTCSVGLAMCCFIRQILIAMFFIVIGVCSSSCASILSALAVEVFPTKLRGLAMCTMYMAGQIGAVVGTSLIGAMIGTWCYILFFMIAIAVASSAISLLLFWPDVAVVRESMESINFTY